MTFAARSSRARWPRPLAGLAFCALLLASPAALARINVVTLPGRDTVQLTIYNSAERQAEQEDQHSTQQDGPFHSSFFRGCRQEA